jgi:hypothetical protein
MWSSVSFQHVLLIHGRFLKSGKEFYLAYVYTPCETDAKKLFWDSLTTRIQLLVGKNVCVCGDFNVV